MIRMAQRETRGMRRHPRRWQRLARLQGIAVGALLLLGSSGPLAQTPYVWSDIGRVVAIGDVHGAYDEMLEILSAVGIVDESLSWSAGTTHLVSVGDLLDRGPDSKDVMELMMRLEQEAKDSGGAVHVLLGNHELMNLVGDLRYVSDAEYADYDDAGARAARASAWAAQAAATEPDSDESTLKADFDQRYPPGYFGHRTAFSAEGSFGRWLLGLPAVVVINDTAFVHGGLPRLVADTSLTDLNTNVSNRLERLLALRDGLQSQGLLPAIDMQGDYQIAARTLARIESDAATANAEQSTALSEFLALHDSMEFGNYGPLWYRGAIYCKPIIEAPILDAALNRLSAQRVVVGHTPTSNSRVQALFDGKLIMLDTGMLASYYGGQPTALVMEHGSTHIRYATSSENQEIDTARREIAYDMTRAELTLALGKAEPVFASTTELDGPTKVSMRLNDLAFDALFLPYDRNSTAQHELAAFAIDELLGFNVVPPTVERQIADTRGALQLIYPDAVSEQLRIEQQRPFGAWCDMQTQIELMYAFDLLTGNSGRDGTNLGFRDDVSDLVLTNHARAFSSTGRLPSSLQADAIELPAGVEAALTGMSETALEAVTGDWLSTRQRRALIARRDELLARFVSARP